MFYIVLNNIRNAKFRWLDGSVLLKQIEMKIEHRDIAWILTT